jgi:hypothetical protein
MILTAADLDKVKQLVSDGSSKKLELLSLEKMTLGAVVELCCAAWEWRSSKNTLGTKVFTSLLAQYPSLLDVWSALNGTRNAILTDRGVFDALPTGFFPLLSKDDVKDDLFGLFLMRFSRAMTGAGFGVELSRAIAAAFGEMADNVCQHSAQEGCAPGLALYKVDQGIMAYAVGDIGQGILSSLRKSLKWQNLKSHKEALYAAVQENATSREDALEGTGFRQVHKSLAFYNGVLRFRSGNSTLAIRGDNVPKTAFQQNVPLAGGFQVSVTCTIGKKVEIFY